MTQATNAERPRHLHAANDEAFPGSVHDIPSAMSSVRAVPARTLE
jgi:hypothetical protein